MDPNRRQGRSDEELLLQPHADPATPTVGPLRINKQDSTSPPPRAASANNHNGPLDSQSYPAPASPPPTAPLPYPAEKLRQQFAAGWKDYTALPEEHIPTAATPESRRRRPSTPQPSAAPRLRFDGSDPNRPTAAGYAYAPRAQEGAKRYEGAQDQETGQRQERTPKPLPSITWS